MFDNEGEDYRNKKTEKSIMQIKQMYLEATLQDPFLPKELLPSDWKGEEAKKMIRKLSRIKL